MVPPRVDALGRRVVPPIVLYLTIGTFVPPMTVGVNVVAPPTTERTGVVDLITEEVG